MLRRWIFILLIITFVWIVVSRFTEIQKLAETLAQGQWQWVAVAALLQVGYYIVYTGIYQSAFYTVEVDSHVGELLPLMFASIFLNVAAPSGGASSAALFMDDAARRGQSPARTAVGTVLVLVADFCSFLVVLVIGLVILFTLHSLKSYEIIGVAILLVIIGGLTGFLLLGLWRPKWLKRLLQFLQRVANGLAARLKRPNFLADDWADHNADEFTEAAIAIAAHPDRLARTLLIALAGQLIDMASLYVLFLAFHQPVELGVLVAGYAMGILFWIVSITPQGIGVVEGMMTLVFTSLGIHAERAAVISLAFRGLTFWLPMTIGFFLLRRVKTFGAEESTRSEVWSIHLAAALTGLMGVINLLSAVTPAFSNRLVILREYSPFSVIHGGHFTAALSGFALILLAANLWRRKRVAWLLTIVVLVISIISHLVKGLDYEEALLATALAGWLIYLRPHFHARSDWPSARQGVETLIAALLFTLAYGAAGFYLLDHHFRLSYNLPDALRQTVILFTQFYNPGPQPITRFGQYFIDSIYIVGMATFGYGLFMLMRPVLARHPSTPEERQRAQIIVRSYGHSSLARLALLDDKLYYFSTGGSLIAYVVKGRVALALGDPIGPPEDVQSCLANFSDLCKENDWEPAYYQVLPDNLEAYKAAGYDTLCIGREGIVDLASFSLSGSEKKGIRSGVNRLLKLGYSAEVIEPPFPPGMLRQLRLVSDEWLTTMHGTEKRFSLGWFDEAYLNSDPVIIIRNAQGSIDAFANIIPEYQANEVTIDLMRHRKQAEKGQMDFLFVSLFHWAQAKGYATFNLGLSALSGIGERHEDPAIERLLHYIYEHVDQFYNFKGLHEFKDKYHPHWSPRYLVYPGPASLPAVTIAMIRADTGDDILWGYLRHST
jgi:phosphatidylglycerol lysyltransferase